MKYTGYVLYDDENPTEIEWCFVIEYSEDSINKVPDGSYEVSYGGVKNQWDFIGEYPDVDVFYVEDKDFHDTFNDACKDILRELFEGE